MITSPDVADFQLELLMEHFQYVRVSLHACRCGFNLAVYSFFKIEWRNLHIIEMVLGLRRIFLTGIDLFFTRTASLVVYILKVEFRLYGSQDVIIPNMNVMISQVLSDGVFISGANLQASLVEQRSIRAMTRIMLGSLILRYAIR